MPISYFVSEASTLAVIVSCFICAEKKLRSENSLGKGSLFKMSMGCDIVNVLIVAAYVWCHL